MNYLLAPDLELEIAGKNYTLSGSFHTLKRIQSFFKKDILLVMQDMKETTFDSCAEIIRIGIDEHGGKAPEIDAIEQWIIDIAGIARIRNILQGWLLICITPKKDREEIKKIVGESLRLQEDSLGENIKKSHLE